MERGEFHRHRNAHGTRDRRHRLPHAFLNFLAVHGAVGRELVEVQLQGVRSRRFEPLRVVRPPAGPGAIERSDDGNGEVGFQATQLPRVIVRAQLVLRVIRKVRCGLGGALRGRLDVVGQRALLGFDLLLEERMHDERGGPGILQLAGDGDVVAERRRSDDDRVGELQPEVTGREVHGGVWAAGGVATGPASFS